MIPGPRNRTRRVNDISMSGRTGLSGGCIVSEESWNDMHVDELMRHLGWYRENLGKTVEGSSVYVSSYGKVALIEAELERRDALPLRWEEIDGLGHTATHLGSGMMVAIVSVVDDGGSCEVRREPGFRNPTKADSLDDAKRLVAAWYRTG